MKNTPGSEFARIRADLVRIRDEAAAKLSQAVALGNPAIVAMFRELQEKTEANIADLDRAVRKYGN